MSDQPGYERRVDWFLNEVRDELMAAIHKWQPINSPHEGYAVIAEELDEFWAEVKRKQTNHDHGAMRNELIQVAAMAARTVVDCLMQVAHGFSPVGQESPCRPRYDQIAREDNLR